MLKLTSVVVLLSLFCKCTLGKKILVDLSYGLDENTIPYPGFPKFKWTNTISAPDPYFQVNIFETSEHMGTHIDVKKHFIPGGFSVDEIPVENFILNTIVIDVSAKCKNNQNYTIQPDDIKFTALEMAVMKRLERNLLIINTGNGKNWGKSKYLGLDDNDPSVPAQFPSFSPEAAQKIVDLKIFKAVGIDAISIDTAYTTKFLAHVKILGADIIGIENVASTDTLPTHQFFRTYMFPMKLVGGTGAPTRLVAEFQPKSFIKAPFTFYQGF